MTKQPKTGLTDQDWQILVGKWRQRTMRNILAERMGISTADLKWKEGEAIRYLIEFYEKHKDKE